jgi:NADH-quinone oxidoreductase subunit N
MNNFYALAPLLTIVLASLFLLLLEAFIKKDVKNYLGYLSILALFVCAFLCVKSWNRNYSYFDGNLILDNLSLLLSLLFLVAASFIILISMKYISQQDMNFGEYYPLFLFALSGMLIMVSSSNLLVIFLGLEVLSISSYAMAGLKRNDEKSSESAVKYFLLGSFASAFLVFGLAILYGAAHVIDISGVVLHLGTGSGFNLMALAGLSLIIIGFAFKIALVPFHMWTPDVYQGAPTPVTAFFSFGPKAVGFAVLIRIFSLYWDWSPGFKAQAVFWLLWVIAVLTMLVGNLMALRQKNIKRILAYSSIAHAGYILIAVLARDFSSLVFYITAYLFMNIGAFSAVIAMSRKGQEYLELEDYAGIGFKYPWIGATLSVFLVSLAGFPPTGGFLAKFYVFSSAVNQGHVVLVVIGVLASLISVFYYLRIIVYMYMHVPSRDVSIDVENPALFLVLFLCLYGVLQLGIFPGNVLPIIKQALSSLAVF